MSQVTRLTLMALFSLLLLLSLSGHQLSLSLWQIWTHDSSFNHCILVYPIFFIGLYLKRYLFEIYPIRFEGLLLPILAVLLTITQLLYFGGFNLFSHICFILATQVLVVMAIGRTISRKIFPLIIFLFFAVPFGTELIIPLQNLTVTISVFLLKLSGIDVIVDGINIVTNRARFYVAEACAGLRFLIANIFVCYIFAFINFQKLRSWLIFAAVSVAIPILGNCIRAYAIMMIGHYSDGTMAAGVDHYVYGWGFFTVLALINLFLGDMISKSEGVIQTETDPIVPFGIYNPTQDKFDPYRHAYEKRNVLATVTLLMIPIVFEVAVQKLQASQHDFLRNLSPEQQLSHIIKLSDNGSPHQDVIFKFDQADYHKVYNLDSQTRLQLSHYKTQDAYKEAVSSINKPYNEVDRLLLAYKKISFSNTEFEVYRTGLVGEKNYITWMTYLYYDEDDILRASTNRLYVQYQYLKKFLIQGHNAGTILIIDTPIQEHETEDDVNQRIASYLIKDGA